MKHNMNSVNITLDIVCLFIILLLIFYLLNRKQQGHDVSNLLFLCLFNILFICGDLTDWCCNGLAKPWFSIVLPVGQFVYYLAIIPLILSLLKYIYNYLSSYRKLSKHYFTIALIISVIHLIGSILTPFTGFYYRISDANIYYRGDFIFVTHILPIVGYCMIVHMTILCWKLLDFHTITALLSYAWMPLLGQVIQIFFRGINTLVPSITLSFLVIFINIQIDRDIQLEKNKQVLSEAQIMNMLSQIQPHFLYNVLTSIRYLCDTNPAKAKECIDDFSIFLHANMDSLTDSSLIPLERELLHVKSYLKLEQQRFGDILKVEYHLDSMDLLLPALSLQPIVENAVRHGIRRKEMGGTIHISSKETKDSFLLIVEDDGAGFTPETVQGSNHVGLSNIRKRLKLQCNGSLQIESIPNVGTTVTIMIPKENIS